MKTLKHDKIYNEKNEIRETIVHLSLDTKNDEIDNIIYYLICAQNKANENDKIGYDARVDAAFEKLAKNLGRIVTIGKRRKIHYSDKLIEAIQKAQD